MTKETKKQVNSQADGATIPESDEEISQEKAPVEGSPT